MAAHGSPDGQFIFDALGRSISPQELANTILADKNYKEGEQVMVRSCYAGKGDYSFAYQLSFHLRAPVTAPTGVLYQKMTTIPFLGINIPFLMRVRDWGTSIGNHGHWETFSSFTAGSTRKSE